jgi:hypothetical protein
MFFWHRIYKLFNKPATGTREFSIFLILLVYLWFPELVKACIDTGCRGVLAIPDMGWLCKADQT